MVQLDYGIVISKFELQSLYYVHFRTNTLEKSMKPRILPAMGYIAPLLYFAKDSIGIIYPKKADIPLNNKKKNK